MDDYIEELLLANLSETEDVDEAGDDAVEM